MEEQYQNRIVGHGEVDPATLTANPENWRVHPKIQKQGLAAILGDVGWVQSVTVNKRTGRLVDGHLRVLLAEEQGAASIPVTYVDLDEDEERRILATLDPLAAMATTDRARLSGLIDAIKGANGSAAGVLEILKAIETKASIAGAPGALTAEFSIAPFSVFDTCSGAWPPTWSSALENRGCSARWSARPGR